MQLSGRAGPRGWRHWQQQGEGGCDGEGSAEGPGCRHDQDLARVAEGTNHAAGTDRLIIGFSVLHTAEYKRHFRENVSSWWS